MELQKHHVHQEMTEDHVIKGTDSNLNVSVQAPAQSVTLNPEQDMDGNPKP